jgi:uncharacterized membrane protein
MARLLDRLGGIQVRQWIGEIRDRLLFLPLLFTLAGAALGVLSVSLDQFLVDSDDLPRFLRTSVDGGRQVLSTIATGLITAYTLMLSLLLVAVQLASSQFSPRTLRNWLGDRVLQRAVGLVLGTVVFCLVVLFRTRDFDDGDSFEPHVSVLLAIALAVASLIVVLRAADHLADSMRVGAVAHRGMAETRQLVEQLGSAEAIDDPRTNPAARPVDGRPERPPPGARVVEAPTAGWVQGIDIDALFDACPDDALLHVPVAVGTFVTTGQPLAWLTPDPGAGSGSDAGSDDEDVEDEIRTAFALGDERTMRQDIGFGIVRLVDVALLALSPALNDANTAKDVIAHLGEVVGAVFEHEERGTLRSRDRRRVMLAERSHAEYLFAAFDQIRGAARAQPQVLTTLVRTLLTLRDEIERRHLPAHVGPVDDLLVEIAQDTMESDQLTSRERNRILDVIPSVLRARAAGGGASAGFDGRARSPERS